MAKFPGGSPAAGEKVAISVPVGHITSGPESKRITRQWTKHASEVRLWLGHPVESPLVIGGPWISEQELTRRGDGHGTEI